MRLSCVIALLCCTLFTQAQTLRLGPDKIKSLDSLFKVQFPATDPGVVVIVAQDGKPFYRKAFGMSDLERNVPLRTEDKLGIGSISKQFAAVAILLLQQDGKLTIKDDIRKYLPAYNTYGRTITIEHILSHTSGIPSYTELYGFDTLANRTISNHQLVKFFESRPLLFEPGSNWSYSNSGFVLAALIVEKITGAPFNDFLRDRIFKPLMMTETSIGSSEYALPGKTNEYSGPTPKGRIKMENQYNWYWAYGAGQIISTVDDMLKWDDALYNPGFLRPDLLALAHRSFILSSGAPANYGLGWAIGPMGNLTVVRHGGAIGGYRAEGIRIPQDHLYLLILSNAATTNSGLLTNRMLSILYDKPGLKENKTIQQSWKGLEGSYESLNAGSRLQSNFGSKPAFITLRVDSLNRITAQRTGGTATSLSVAGRDSLFDRNNPYTLWTVERQADGSVSGFRVSSVMPSSGPSRFNRKINSSLPASRQPEKTDSLSLVKYTGTFTDPFGERARILIDKGQLYVEESLVGQRTALHPLNSKTFWIRETDTEVYFDQDTKGKITGLRYFSGSYDIVLRRVEEIY